MKFLVPVAVLLGILAVSDVVAQTCTPNPGQLYARLEDIRFSDQFSGATVAARVSAAGADLLSTCSVGGVVVIPSHEPSGGPPTSCTGIGGITIVDLRGDSGSGSGISVSRCHNSSGYIGMQVYSNNLISGNAISIQGSALAFSHNDQSGYLGDDTAGEGANVIGVKGVVASRRSPGVYGVNYGSRDPVLGPTGGPGVQGDTVALPDSVGVLGVADTGGTATRPTRAISGYAVAQHALAGDFLHDSEQLVARFHSNATAGAGVRWAGGTEKWQIVATGSTAPSAVGANRFAILNEGTTNHPFHIAANAPASALHLESGGMAIGSGGTAIAKSVSGSSSWTPGTINDNATTAATFTVTGAAVGDPCFPGLSHITTSGYLATCSVTSADTVTVMLLNKTGAQQTLGSGTVRATVFHY